MASDRRKSTKRGGRAVDRRKSADRRLGSNYRQDGDISADTFEQVKAPKKVSRPKRAARTAKKVGCFKMCLICIALALVLGCVIGGLLFANFEYVVSSLSKTISISVKKVAIASSELTDKKITTQISFVFYNALPFRVIIQKIECGLELSDYELFKGIAFKPCYIIDGRKSLEVPVACKANSITVRRALKKGFAAQTAARGSGELSIKKDEIASGDLKSISKISGKALFKLKLFNFELPFNKAFKL